MGMYEAKQRKEKNSRTISFSNKTVMPTREYNAGIKLHQQKKHDKKCSCALCCGINRKELMPIQMCPKCMNPQCKYGEICKIGDDLDGLLPKSIDGVEKVKFYNQTMGHNGLPKEWEHPFPKLAMKKSGFDFYGSSPVFELDKFIHRNAMDGGGNGVSSTGYSEIAQEWAQYIADTVGKEGLCAGIRLGILDDISALYANNSLKEGHVSTFMQIIRGYVEKRLITKNEAETLSAEIYNHIYNLLHLQNFRLDRRL